MYTCLDKEFLKSPHESLCVLRRVATAFRAASRLDDHQGECGGMATFSSYHLCAFDWSTRSRLGKWHRHGGNSVSNARRR